VAIAAASSPPPFSLFSHRRQNSNPANPTTTSVPTKVAPTAIPATAPVDSSPRSRSGVLIALGVAVGDPIDDGDVEEEGAAVGEADDNADDETDVASPRVILK
ncbi:hypothetical protein CMEL01_00915, partial [Colletotrichum melonis]